MREPKRDVTGPQGLRQVLFGLCMAAMAVISQNVEAAGTADSKTSATRLIYHEIEEGVEAYDNQYLITDRYLRISDPDDTSGYILFDANENRIYSVSHFDKSILVIPEYPLKEIHKSYRDVISFDKLHDAPTIDGRSVYSYRGEAIPPDGGEALLCTDIQLVPDLLPATANMLRRYMQVLSSQQQTDLEKTPPELRTPCFLQDQVFNTGEYYRKGMPVREWHSNGKQRLLLDFGEVEVESSLFALPTDYRRFSIEQGGQVPQAPSL